LGQGGAVERLVRSSANCGGRHGRVTPRNRSDCRAGGGLACRCGLPGATQTALPQSVNDRRLVSTWAIWGAPAAPRSGTFYNVASRVSGERSRQWLPARPHKFGLCVSGTPLAELFPGLVRLWGGGNAREGMRASWQDESLDGNSSAVPGQARRSPSLIKP